MMMWVMMGQERGRGTVPKITLSYKRTYIHSYRQTDRQTDR